MRPRSVLATLFASALLAGGCGLPTATPPLVPTAELPRSLQAHLITRTPTARPVVALTFDGGSGAQGARSIVATLESQQVRATFFLTGAFIRAHGPLTRRIARDGFVIGNHTDTHPHLNALSDDAVQRQIRRGARALEAATGLAAKPWLRFPFGEYTVRTLRIVNDMGYAAIGWTVDTRGWMGTAETSAAGIVARVSRAAGPGVIVLMHVGANPADGSTLDADALPTVIRKLREAGYGFTTVRRLLTAAGSP
jgi:peptidoglycan/xylan/chitin deacetylase (PgdA/CDA1 family)